MNETLSVGVKELIQFACSTGDLVREGPAGPTAREGIAAHKRIQAERHKDEEVEVALSTHYIKDDVSIKISGRVDLINKTDTPPILTEIKSTYVALEHLSESVVTQYWNQLRIYAALFLLNRDNDEDVTLDAQSDDCHLRLLIINLRNSEVQTAFLKESRAQLIAFLDDAITTWLAWQKRLARHREAMRLSATTLKFPFPDYRQGQYQMAANVYRSLRDGDHLMCEAPTGTGKSISAVFPACKALAEQHVQQICYLTAKNSGKQAAAAALALLRQSGFDVVALTISSKRLTCHCQNSTCELMPDGRCPRTVGFYDRLPEAREDLLDRRLLDGDTIDRVAHQHNVCPFELSLQMVRYADFVICDYNYVFDPLVKLISLIDNADTIGFLVDEAHNLADRSRAMYSARLNTAQLREIVAICENELASIASAAKSLDRKLSSIASSFESLPASTNELPGGLMKQLDKAVQAILESEVAAASLPSEQKFKVWEVLRELMRSQVIGTMFDHQHRLFVDEFKSGRRRNIQLDLSCIDASRFVGKTFEQLHAAVVFSATLRPYHFHMDMLGLPETVTALSLPPVYKPEQTGCYLCTWIDTRFHSRQKSGEDLVQLIHSVINARSGNYLVFFPSYQYMQTIAAAFGTRFPGTRILVQDRDSSSSERESFLKNFEKAGCTLGFAIMAGVYGEGLDYQGDALIGTIIVGTGLPGYDLKMQERKDSLDTEGYNGFDYAYRFPGFVRVLQAAGRVIRSESDKGVVILVDPRFNTQFYRRMFPSNWQATQCDQQDALDHQLCEFWCGSKRESAIT